ncbi:hypothetical protein N2152v2_007498 [Parachlorella kessleri]
MVLGLLLSIHFISDHDQAGLPRHRRDLQEGPIDLLRSANIIPNIVDAVNSSSGISMAVQYDEASVRNGLLIPASQAQRMPNVTITGANNSLLTLVLVDPDALNPQFLHWLVTNIPDGDVGAGQQTTPYRGPAPPSGEHRYVFLLYRQPSKNTLQIMDPSKGTTAGRAGFRARTFAALNTLGNPVAVLYFLSQR